CHRTRNLRHGVQSGTHLQTRKHREDAQPQPAPAMGQAIRDRWAGLISCIGSLFLCEWADHRIGRGVFLNVLIVGRPQTSRTSSFLPSAAAYFSSVAIDGECLPVISAFSSLATAGAFVPILSATCAWVSPASVRAWRMRSNIGISFRSMRAYSARTAGLSNIFAFICS